MPFLIENITAVVLAFFILILLGNLFLIGIVLLRRRRRDKFFARIDGNLWQATKERYPKSKTRAGYAFAEAVDLHKHPVQLAQLRRIWNQIRKYASGREEVGDDTAEPAIEPKTASAEDLAKLPSVGI